MWDLIPTHPSVISLEAASSGKLSLTSMDQIRWSCHASLAIRFLVSYVISPFEFSGHRNFSYLIHHCTLKT